MKSIAIIAALLAVVLSAITHAATDPTLPYGASAVPAASSVAAPTTLGK